MLKFPNGYEIIYLNIVFIVLANSADADEMPHSVVFHLQVQEYPYISVPYRVPAVKTLLAFDTCMKMTYITYIIEPRHEISNNVVCATSKASDQPAHTRSLIRAFASRLDVL